MISPVSLAAFTASSIRPTFTQPLVQATPRPSAGLEKSGNSPSLGTAPANAPRGSLLDLSV